MEKKIKLEDAINRIQNGDDKEAVEVVVKAIRSGLIEALFEAIENECIYSDGDFEAYARDYDLDEGDNVYCRGLERGSKLLEVALREEF